MISRSARPSRGTLPASHATAIGSALYELATQAVRRVPRELSLSSAATLATLARTGPRRITDLAVSEGVTQPAMTTLVRRLAEAGLVRRTGDASDGRVTLVALTESGAEYVQTRRRRGIAGFALLVDKLPVDDRAALLAAVPALRQLASLDGTDGTDGTTLGGTSRDSTDGTSRDGTGGTSRDSLRP